VAVPENDDGKGCKDHIGRSIEDTRYVDQRHDPFVGNTFSFECIHEQIAWTSTSKGDEKNEDDAVKCVDSGRDVDEASLPLHDHDPEEEDCQTNLEENGGEDVESVVYNDIL